MIAHRVLQRYRVDHRRWLDLDPVGAPPFRLRAMSVRASGVPSAPYRERARDPSSVVQPEHDVDLPRALASTRLPPRAPPTRGADERPRVLNPVVPRAASTRRRGGDRRYWVSRGRWPPGFSPLWVARRCAGGRRLPD